MARRRSYAPPGKVREFVEATLSAGFTVETVELAADGTIRMMRGGPKNPADEFDEWEPRL